MSKSQPQAKVQKTAAAGIDPKQHKVNVIMTDGTKFEIMTTWGKEGETLRLDVDTKNHPAWQKDGKSLVNLKDQRVEKFKSKFGNFDFVGSDKKEENAA